MDEYGWSTQSFHWFKISYFSHIFPMETEEFWGIQLLPSCYRQGFLGRFYLRDLSQAVVVPVKLHVAVQRIRKRKKPKKLVAPNTSRVGRRGNVGKIHGKNTQTFPMGNPWGLTMSHEPWLFFRCESRMFLCLCFHGWRCVRCVNLFWVLVAGWCRASRNVWTNFGVTRPGIWLSGPR